MTQGRADERSWEERLAEHRQRQERAAERARFYKPFFWGVLATVVALIASSEWRSRPTDDSLFLEKMRRLAPVISQGASDAELIETGMTTCHLLSTGMTHEQVVANTVALGAPESEAKVLYREAAIHVCDGD